jgi:hypothetical protein
LLTTATPGIAPADTSGPDTCRATGLALDVQHLQDKCELAQKGETAATIKVAQLEAELSVVKDGLRISQELVESLVTDKQRLEGSIDTLEATVTLDSVLRAQSERCADEAVAAAAEREQRDKAKLQAEVQKSEGLRRQLELLYHKYTSIATRPAPEVQRLQEALERAEKGRANDAEVAELKAELRAAKDRQRISEELVATLAADKQHLEDLNATLETKLGVASADLARYKAKAEAATSDALREGAKAQTGAPAAQLESDPAERAARLHQQQQAEQGASAQQAPCQGSSLNEAAALELAAQVQRLQEELCASTAACHKERSLLQQALQTQKELQAKVDALSEENAWIWKEFDAKRVELAHDQQAALDACQASLAKCEAALASSQEEAAAHHNTAEQAAAAMKMLEVHPTLCQLA